MIEKLNLRDSQILQQILTVQIPAYQVEAELIGFDGIPQLRDTVETIRNSGEIFYGFFENSKLIGFIALEETEKYLDICRLVVHPSHFRKGVAGKLLMFIIRRTNKSITVSTGAKNEPAIALYKKHGFQIRSKAEVAPGVFIAQMFNSDPLRNNNAIKGEEFRDGNG